MRLGVAVVDAGTVVIVAACFLMGILKFILFYFIFLDNLPNLTYTPNEKVKHGDNNSGPFGDAASTLCFL